MMRKKEDQIMEEQRVMGAMACLEVITVRIAQKDEWQNARNLCTQVFHTVEKEGLVSLKVYRSSGYRSDLSVHINRQVEPFGQEKSLLGLQIAKGLSTFGIISHTVWMDQEIIADIET